MKLSTVVATFALAALTGCAASARVEMMTVIPDSPTPLDCPLRSNLGIGSVRGGEETNPLWTSKVGEAEFRAALEASLAHASLLGDANARYLLDAVLLELDQPAAGFDMTVTTRARYSVRERATSDVVWTHAFAASFTATIGDAFYGPSRMQLANEGSVRESFRELIVWLQAFRLPEGRAPPD